MVAPTRELILELEGILQGVGLRPTLQRLASEAGLGGYAQNRSGTVRLSLRGAPERVESFVRELPVRLPHAARLERLRVLTDAFLARADAGPFEILPSDANDPPRVAIPEDLAMCPACRADVDDPTSRFHGYPFTTCTDCGPRYTVVDGMPYDRERTSLSAFPMCATCRREYEDPASRRFHAESLACPVCGPRLRLLAPDGRALGGNPLRMARFALARGRIVAVRGIGGFLLAVDARDPKALARLRLRKQRPHKPFAVLARDVESLRAHAHVGEAEERLLISSRGPIVILDRRADVVDSIAWKAIAPDANTVGAMLPTSPLHALLLEPLPGDRTPSFDLLVLTSGNARSEPIAIGNEEALTRLGGIADLYLTHDREIVWRNDDSLVRVVEGCEQIWRRARGFAPGSLPRGTHRGRTVLAFGPELKNTLALGFDEEVVLSPHVGDLTTAESIAALSRLAETLPRYFDREPEVVAVDLHPDYASTRLGERYAAERDLPIVRVQHHHAHAAAALAEMGQREGLAIVFDGTGYGCDGSIWGAELLHVDGRRMERCGSFRPVPLPGGDAAVREPARQLAGRWMEEKDDAALERWSTFLGVPPSHWEVWRAQARGEFGSPRSHAAGRVFDAVAAACALLRDGMTYEGRGPVRLEALAERHASRARSTGASTKLRAEHVDRMLWIDWTPWFANLFGEGPPSAERREEIAWDLHDAMADAVLAMALHGRERHGVSRVALTGGVFQNRLLVHLARERLERHGLEAFVPSRVPVNDGGVSYGQVVVASHPEESESCVSPCR